MRNIKVTEKIIVVFMILILIFMLGIWYVSYGTTTTQSVGTNVEATFNDLTGELTILSTSGKGTLEESSYTAFIETIGKDKIKIITFSNGVYAYNTDEGLFSSYINLETINNISCLDTSVMTDMSYMFAYCKSLTNLDLSGLDTSNVTTMEAMFDECRKLINLKLSGFDTSKVTNMNSMFSKCYDLISLDLSSFDTKNVTDMSFMFYDCADLKELNLSSFDTSNVTSMYSMFYYCKVLTNLNLSSFNTSNVKEMAYMFYQCKALTNLDLRNFNTSNVKSMGYMFYGCELITSLDLSNFNTSNVIDMGNMFSYCFALTDLNISSFNTSNVKNMRYMFEGSDSLESLDLSNFDTSNVFDMTHMLFGTSLNDIYTPYLCSAEVMDLNDTYYNVTDTTDTVAYTSITEDTFSGSVHLVKHFKIVYDANGGTGEMNSLIDNFEKMIPYTTVIIKDNEFTSPNGKKFYNWNTKADGTGELYKENDRYSTNANLKLYAQWISTTAIVGTNVEATFDELTGNVTITSTSGIGTLDPIKYTTFIEFWGKENIETITFSNKVYACDVEEGLFYEYESLTTINNISNLDTSKMTNMSNMFAGCYELTGLDLSNFDTSNVTDMSNMFDYCVELIDLDVSGFDTSNVTNMNNMFNNCNSLTKLDLSNFDVSNVTDMNSMFTFCEELISLDLSSFETTEVTNMSNMFAYCFSLINLDLSSFNTRKVINMNEMFIECSSLEEVDLSNFDTSNVTDMSNMFDGCSSLISLDLSSFDVSNVTDMSNIFNYCILLNNIKTPHSYSSAIMPLYGSYYNMTDITDRQAYKNITKDTFSGSVHLIKEVTIKYYSNDGTGMEEEEFVLPYAMIEISENYFTPPSGKIFYNWNTKADGTGTSYLAYDEYEACTNLTLYAQWINEDGYYFSSIKYEIGEDYVSKVSPNTSVDEFLDNMNTNGTAKIYNLNGQEVIGSALVGTGYTLQVEFNGTTYEYEIVVRGDIDGNGKITVTDLSMLNQHIVRRITLTGAKEKAADIEYSGKITVTDLSMMNQALVGRITL